MVNVEPFIPILEQINRLISLIKEETGKPHLGKVTKRSVEQLRELENLVLRFREVMDSLFQTSDYKPPTPRELTTQPLTTEQQQFFNKLAQLEAQVEAECRYFQGVIQQEQLRMMVKKEATKKQTVKRKKKFRGVGGSDKGWMSV